MNSNGAIKCLKWTYLSFNLEEKTDQFFKGKISKYLHYAIIMYSATDWNANSAGQDQGISTWLVEWKIKSFAMWAWLRVKALP
jgi:hypothetical protein